MRHNWLDGLKKVPLHLLTLGLFGAVITYFGGWGAAVVISVLRTYEEILATMHSHPTLSEAVMEAAAASLGEAIHI